MPGKTEKQSFEMIREGFAWARFGGQFSGAVIPGEKAPITLAAVEDNGGLNPEEYFVANCRLLSLAVTPYRRFDFMRDGVLKAAVSLFDGLTLYANHDADVTQWKGRMQAPVWDGANTPNGINGQAVFDRTVDPMLARGVETKALRSFSVTIWFNYERSHPDLANFYERLGEIIDGEMVRFIVTEITNAGEVSVVWEGEDPYAKTFKAGTEGSELGAGKHRNHKEGGDTMKLTAATCVLLALAADADPSPEELEAKIREKFTGLETKITTLETEAVTLKADAAIGVQTLTETRERATTLYKALKGDKFQQTFVDGVIGKADLATARALVTEYEAETEKNIPLTCPKCGEKLSRRSSVENQGGNAGLGGKRAEDYKL